MIFEYKVKCRHGLGWKEIVLYADTDIEEFFNRNSIDYVRNATDTVENRLFKENKRLNNIINELEDILKRDIKACNNKFENMFDRNYRRLILEEKLEQLQELKGSDKE